jgi:hypothetical protein
MSPPNHPVWQNSAPAGDNYREEHREERGASPRAASPRRDERERERSPAPRRDRSRSPGRNGGGEDRGR